VTFGIIAAIVVVVLIVNRASDTVRVVDGRATMTVATVDECASTTFAIALQDVEDFDTAVSKLFAALRETEGVGVVTAYADNPRIEIAYCQSYSSEPVLRSLLEPTGYIAP
jgi:hypothetical protein